MFSPIISLNNIFRLTSSKTDIMAQKLISGCQNIPPTNKILASATILQCVNLISKVNVTMSFSAEFQGYFLFRYEFRVGYTTSPNIYRTSQMDFGENQKFEKLSPSLLV